MVEYDVEQHTRDEVRIRLRGELAGPGSTGTLQGSLERHFVDDGVSVICVDLRDVPFIDSSGIVTLVMLQRDSARQGKRFVIEGAEGQVRAKLRITGLLEFLGGH